MSADRAPAATTVKSEFCGIIFKRLRLTVRRLLSQEENGKYNNSPCGINQKKWKKETIQHWIKI